MGVSTESKVDLANQALTLLGAAHITSFVDGDTNSDTMSHLYASTKQTLLRGYKWNFATKRAVLAQLSETPLTGEYNFMYALPSDSLRLFEIWSTANRGLYRADGSDYKWSVEGRNVLTNAKPAVAVYVHNADEGDFGPQFAQAFIDELAKRACYAITSSNARYKDLSNEAKMSLEEARTVDVLEGTTKPLTANRFTEVRL